MSRVNTLDLENTVDTRPIWPDRIELIYQAYLAENKAWPAINPIAHAVQYRKECSFTRVNVSASNTRSSSLPSG